MAENNLGSTQYFRTKPDQELEVKEILDLVYNAMEEKGYNPVNQMDAGRCVCPCYGGEGVHTAWGQRSDPASGVLSFL